ncbi:MAG TPA: pectate lyase [Roseimicrobium sp.]|nr:pectate lyase [Roseimicrobium sp.]
MKQRFGEEKATDTQIWTQFPGTPAVGMAFLRAHLVTGDSNYLAAARLAGTALVRGQLESGGWDYLIDFSAEQGMKSYRRSDVGKIDAALLAKRKNVTTFDDDVTQGTLRFLMTLSDTTKGSRLAEDIQIRDAVEYGLKKLMGAQYLNGAWPQRFLGLQTEVKADPRLRASIPKDWPKVWSKEPYYSHYTLNDQSHRQCVLTLLEAHRLFGKPEYLQAAIRGGDFLLLAQLPSPQSGWAQQYNHRMEPAWARAFEPPALSSGESVGAIRTLVDLFVETGEERFMKVVPRGLEWLEKSSIGTNRWSRFYELGSNRPLYGDRDGKVHYTLAELSDERRTGYGWEGDFGVASVKTYYGKVKADGREEILRSKSPTLMTLKQKESRRRALEKRVQSILKEQGMDGGWVHDGWLEMKVFVQNMGVLSDYIETYRTSDAPGN